MVFRGWKNKVKRNKIVTKGIFFKINIQYAKELHRVHNDLVFLPEIMRIGNIKNLVAKLYEKNKNMLYIYTI